MANPGEDGDDLSPEEANLLRFQYDNELQLKIAHLGIDMDHFVHVDPAGKHLVESAIDNLQAALMLLMEVELTSPAAKALQVKAQACKMVVDAVMETLENGRVAAFDISDQQINEEDAQNG